MSTEFAPHYMTSDTTPGPYVVSANSVFSTLPAWKAFDGGSDYLSGSSDYCIMQNGLGSLPAGSIAWIKLDQSVDGSALLDSYGIKVNTIPEPNRAPKDFTIEESNDDSTWTVLDTQAGQTGWASGELRTFSASGGSYARYHRLNISANNGDASFTQVAELYLSGTATLTTVKTTKVAIQTSMSDSNIRTTGVRIQPTMKLSSIRVTGVRVHISVKNIAPIHNCEVSYIFVA